MRKAELKVGDRVACYSWPAGRQFGEVVGVGEHGIDVHIDGHPGRATDGVTFHPKQCRRLRPAMPRRSVWLKVEQVDRHYYPPDIAWLEDAADFEYTEFREVRPRRKP